MPERISPHIGFVILVWNSEKVADACLKSIAELKMILPQVVVVDNGSTDGTVQIVNRYIEENPRSISMIHYDENRGTTISRNAGIKALKDVDYYCILDSDTVVNDEAFLKLIHEMEQHPKYGIIGPTMMASSGVVQMSARCFPTLQEKICKGVPVKWLQKKGEEMEVQRPPAPEAVSYPVDYLMSACWLIRPEVLKKAGLLDEKIFYAPEDAEYCIRVWKAGYQVAFCPGAQIIHEWQRLSKKKLFSKMNWEHIKGLGYMFRKHHYLFTTKKMKKSFGK